MLGLPREIWSDAIAQGVASVPEADLIRAAEEILRADIVLTAGNGGSAALASHAAQAISKPSYEPGGGHPAVCLTDNVPLLTAHANDGGWESALAETGRPLIENLKCALLLISSSGKSENICRLGRLALGFHRPIIALTGFGGGPLRAMATVSIHVPSDDYEIVEPSHDALLHRIQFHIRGRRAAA